MNDNLRCAQQKIDCFNKEHPNACGCCFFGRQIPRPTRPQGLQEPQGIPQEALSICRIASITITSSIYNENITYMPAPSPLPTGCDANCEAALRSYLPVGTPNVSINSGGQTVAQGSILKSEYGMVVVVGNNNSNPSFVSLCKAEIVTK